MTDQQTQNSSRTWMLIVGAIAVLAGGFYAWNAYRTAMASQSVFDSLGSTLHADFTQMWIGIAVVAVGVILLFTVWVISAARK